MSVLVDVAVLGAYGNFGQIIAKNLVAEELSVVLVGRQREKLQVLTERLQQPNKKQIHYHVCDVNESLDALFAAYRPTVVINAVGPYQAFDYRIPKTCIQHRIHYIDLADAREYVANINELDTEAKAHDVVVIVGASSVPTLSSAVLEHFAKDFQQIDFIRYGIIPGLKTSRGLGTTESVLSYVGKPFSSWKDNREIRVFGWQDIYRVYYPGVGYRWMANCDIPDLALFPKRYPVNSMQFSAGIDSSILHLGLWLMSWVVRVARVKNLARLAKPLLKASHFFDRWGSDIGVMHFFIEGMSREGHKITKKWYLIARKGQGLEVPCAPSILLAKRLIDQILILRGAMPAIGIISLEDYLKALEPYGIEACLET